MYVQASINTFRFGAQLFVTCSRILFPVALGPTFKITVNGTVINATSVNIVGNNYELAFPLSGPMGPGAADLILTMSSGGSDFTHTVYGALSTISSVSEFEIYQNFVENELLVTVSKNLYPDVGTDFSLSHGSVGLANFRKADIGNSYQIVADITALPPPPPSAIATTAATAGSDDLDVVLTDPMTTSNFVHTLYGISISISVTPFFIIKEETQPIEAKATVTKKKSGK